MLLKEIVDMYSPKAEVVSVVTTEEIDFILSQKLGIKKADYDDVVWAEIVSRSKKAVVDNFKEALLIDLIGKSLAEYVKEGPISLGFNNN